MQLLIAGDIPQANLAQARLWTGKDLTELPVKEVKAAVAAEIEKSHR